MPVTDAAKTSPSMKWALAFGAVYFSISVLFKGAVPFAPFPFLPFPARHGPVAVPAMLADGRPALAEEYDSFQGIDPAFLAKREFPYPVDRMYRFDEQRLWIADHLSVPKALAGPVEIQVGFWILEIDAEGRLTSSFMTTARGTACRRK